MADCPARTAIEVIANKWTVVTLYALADGPKRPGELVDLSGGISRKVLTETLRRLQRHGLVDRQRYAEAPPRVEYSLTALGRTLQEPITMLTAWAQEHGAALADFQEAAADQKGSIGAP
ncbi:winged helix-turn-helix transcriptional regulator [Kitasatospora sp. NPDC056138]|uniref:winged helix-turn-helix transcriptional regulator n=1 Tax=Kitasatospora sp. NPDC056138 TaxID=3345724 RepID=UPI0035D8BEF0